MKTVLIAEDNPTKRALAMVEQTPDIRLLDIGMPVLDGCAVVRTLRENPRFPSLPVVAVTAYSMPGDRDKS